MQKYQRPQSSIFAQKGRLRRGLYLCALVTFACINDAVSQVRAAQNVWPAVDWSKTKPEAQGMDSKSLKEAEYIYPRLFPSGYSLLVIRNGSIVSESYFHGQTAETSNHIYSITKTMVATLTGIAVQQGWIEGVKQPVADLLPQYSFHPKLEAMTLEDVLTHRSGVRSSNNLEDLLGKEPLTAPGASFEYSNHAPNLLTAILDRIAKQGLAGTATDVPALADNYLFKPLGMHPTEWSVGPLKIPEGGNGLHMTSRDLARLGYLLLKDGRWNNEQLLPADWVKEASMHRVGFDREKGYGYLNWVRKNADIVQTSKGKQNVQGYFAYGHRGQFIGIYPELDLLVVTTADANDASRDTFFVPDLLHDFVRRFIFSSIKDTNTPPGRKEIRMPQFRG